MNTVKPSFVVLAAILSVSLLSVQACQEAGGGQESLAQAVDRIFEDIDQSQMPGCAAGVIHNGEYVLKQGYGLANLEHGIPITPQSVFRTGSVSKQFTSMAIAILSQRGEIDLQADIHTYLPDLMDYGQEVTIWQMVHHTAGMGDYDPQSFTGPDGKPFQFGNEDYWTIQEFFEAVRAVPLNHPPETQWEYSNLAYFLLSQVVESVTGQTLRQFAEAEIFGPLGMAHTMFNDNVNQVVENRVDGYRRMDDGSYEIFMTNLSWVGDGGVYTTLDDFIQWDRNFYDNRLGDGTAGLIEMTTTPDPDAVPTTRTVDGAGYAFGHFIGSIDGHRTVGHSGGWVGFSALYLRFPELSMSVVTFCNSTDANAPALGREVALAALAALPPD